MAGTTTDHHNIPDDLYADKRNCDREEYSVNSICRLLILALVLPALSAADEPEPIIDVHFHTYTGKIFSQRRDGGNLVDLGDVTLDEALRNGVEVVRKYNILAITSGPTPELVDQWVAADPEHFVPALQIGNARLDRTYLNMIRDRASNGKLRVLGEIAFQYEGISPDDAVYDIYFSLANELDIPVAIHLGPGPITVFDVRPGYRIAAGDPILLESVLQRYPDLRIYVMHAGWPFLDNMMAILYSYPNVYVDLSDIATSHEETEYYRSLRILVESGFGDRIMFGSDPYENAIAEMVATAIERINSADFLSEQQKRDILYNNAAHFFRIEEWAK
jgi:hypothetical protein